MKRGAERDAIGADQLGKLVGGVAEATADVQRTLARSRREDS
jgi:hypothetical protein